MVTIEVACNERALLGWRVLVAGQCVGIFRELADAEFEYHVWRAAQRGRRLYG